MTTRLTSNIIADLTIVPTIVILGTDGITGFRGANFARYLEASTLALGVAVVALVVFNKGNASGSFPAIICTRFPLLLWAAVRFGPGGLSACMLAVTLISM
jgi:integral membrane sensor domain MASE1